MKKLENFLEKNIKIPVLLLREYGFNTFCSCGCPPNPYIQMEIYFDDEITKLYNLLIENGYKDFFIKFYWDTQINSKCLEVVFRNLKIGKI
jgi:hypothetical protein